MKGTALPARRRRTESEEVRREQLLTAARKVFQAKSYNAATIADIVREAGVAQGTFYLYYSSKNAIAVALRDRLMSKMATAVGEAIHLATSFDEKLGSLVTASFQVARENADLYKPAFMGADEAHPEMHSESAEHDAFLHITTDLFMHANSAGDMKALDPEIMARLALGLLQHAIIEAFVFGDGDEAERLEKGVREFLANALVR